MDTEPFPQIVIGCCLKMTSLGTNERPADSLSTESTRYRVVFVGVHEFGRFSR